MLCSYSNPLTSRNNTWWLGPLLAANRNDFEKLEPCLIRRFSSFPSCHLLGAPVCIYSCRKTTTEAYPVRRFDLHGVRANSLLSLGVRGRPVGARPSLGLIRDAPLGFRFSQARRECSGRRYEPRRSSRPGSVSALSRGCLPGSGHVSHRQVGSRPLSRSPCLRRAGGTRTRDLVHPKHAR